MSRTRELVLVAPDLFDRGGGIARIARSTALACHQICQERGWRFTALSLLDDGARRDDSYLPVGAEYLGYGGDKRALARGLLWRAVRPSHVGTVFCHVNLARLGVLYPPRRFGLARDYAVIVHGVDVWKRLSAPHRLALKLAREVWSVSDFTGHQVSQAQGVPSSRVKTIHNCLDPFWLGHSAAAKPPAERYVLCVSRMSRADRYKGMDDLIVAFGLAAGRVPGLQLVLAGDGDDAARLRAVAASGPVPDRIAFVGGVSDEELRGLYEGCELFALPSGKEGFGLVFLEAMSFGKPVLAAASAAVPEVVVNGETGLLVGFGDIGGLTGALLELTSNRERARQMGERGRARVAERFAFPRYVSDLRSAVERIWEGPAAGHLGGETQ